MNSATFVFFYSLGEMGFVKILNRICVALSRARKGFYCFGNFTMLSQEKIWNDIIETMKKANQFGETLRITCLKHPQNDIDISNANDFDKRPEGNK